jgi:hypothetical protein
MKLLHTKLARSIWLFDILDLNPKGKALLGELLTWIEDTYNFAVAPDSDNPVPNTPSPGVQQAQTPPLLAAGGFLFQRGSFQAREDIFIAISNLTIYDDGIVVDTTSSTDDADQFADTLLKSAASEFKLQYDPDMIRRKLYLSELIFRSDMVLDSLNPRLCTFANSLPKTLINDLPLHFGVGSVQFWSEPNDAGLHRVVKVEKQLGKASSERRFYSDAPLQTRAHLGVLEEFEKLVMGA